MGIAIAIITCVFIVGGFINIYVNILTKWALNHNRLPSALFILAFMVVHPGLEPGTSTL